MAKTFTYRYASDYATIQFDVVGQDDWSEEMFDDASSFDLTDYATNPEDYFLEDCWNKENN